MGMEDSNNSAIPSASGDAHHGKETKSSTGQQRKEAVAARIGIDRQQAG